MPNLQTDIRQLFSHAVLRRFDRLAEAGVQFTFDEADVYLSVFSEAMQHLEIAGFQEHDDTLASYARVFERFVSSPFTTVGPSTAGTVAAALYWLSGYSANSLLLAKAVLVRGHDGGIASEMLLKFLSRDLLSGNAPDHQGQFVNGIREYLRLGTPNLLVAASQAAQQFVQSAFDSNHAADFVSAKLLAKVVDRLGHISIWATLPGRTSAPIEGWQHYMAIQMEARTPLIDLWPSQRQAIQKGLLDGTSSLTLRMPTSAGKTKMTELAFANDLLSDPQRRCLYLAPFRALVSEVEGQLGESLARLGFPVASLYGGSDANILEAQLTEEARVIVATPEKIEAVLSLAGKDLSEFGTVVLDEGHLLDSGSRGAAYELQLAELRSKLHGIGRTIFLSAVLPNSEEIASWLGGSAESLADEQWQPTTMRAGVVVWPEGEGKTAQLTYLSSTGQQLVDKFFVPRIIDEDVWKEISPETGRLRTHRFPRRGNNGSISAALAFGYAKDGPVLIFARRPDWAESVTTTILERLALNREIDTHLINDENQADLIALADYVGMVLGEYSSLPAAIRSGLAFHHGQLPQSIRLVIEDEYRKQTIRLLIATNTLAQGVNLPARTIIVHSLPDTDNPVRDFWNLAGRAGRALKESEGEIIILATGSVKARTIKRFLDRNEIEPIESRILSFVLAILQSGNEVTNAAIDALLQDQEQAARYSEVVEAMDLHLLELLAEELSPEQQQEKVEEVVRNLLATYQAEKRDIEGGTQLRAAVQQFAGQRQEATLARVPEAARRKRYAAAGLSIGSCIAIENTIDPLIGLLREQQDLTQQSFDALIDTVSGFRELNGANAGLIKQLGFRWLNLATYAEIFEGNEGAFENFGESIRFVENILCYRTPWALNGVVRLVQARIEEDIFGDAIQLPEWVSYLPQLLRYGVPTRELMWVMSLGVPERKVAVWLLELFQSTRNRRPNSLNEFVGWGIGSRNEVLPQMEAAWPKYFARMYGGIIDRYEQMQQILAE